MKNITSIIYVTIAYYSNTRVSSIRRDLNIEIGEGANRTVRDIVSKKIYMYIQNETMINRKFL